jgi:hypothetical protein
MCHSLVRYYAQLFLFQAITKGIAKHIHDAIFGIQWLNPRINVSELIVIRATILGKGNHLMIVLIHLVVRHLVFAEVQLNNEKTAL